MIDEKTKKEWAEATEARLASAMKEPGFKEELETLCAQQKNEKAFACCDERVKFALAPSSPVLLKLLRLLPCMGEVNNVMRIGKEITERRNVGRFPGRHAAVGVSVYQYERRSHA